MPEGNKKKKFRLKKKKDEIRNYLIEEINQNEIMSKKHKKNCRVLSYNDHSLILIFTITGCVSISAYASLVEIPVEIASCTTELTICVIISGIKMYKAIRK